MLESEGLAPGYLLSRPLRVGLYLALNVGVLLALGIAAAVYAPADPRILYVVLLTALCTSPLLQLERINGPFFLLAVYLVIFYSYFGIADLMWVLTDRTPVGRGGVLSAAEAVILIAAACAIGGYHAGVRWLGGKGAMRTPAEWPFRAVLGVGLALWVVGTGCLVYWQTFIITDRSNATLMKNLSALGMGLTTVFMIGQLIQPLGVLLVAYAYARRRRAYLLALVLLVVLVQIVLGFVADFKGEAMQGGILVIITRTYVDGRLPKAWLTGGALFILLAFPVFQAYRLQVRGEEGVTSARALSNLIETLESSVQANEKVENGVGGSAYKSQSFWERASLKPSVDLIVERIGNDKPYQWGDTLTPIAAAFIPKILWADKPSLAVGQIFNQEFSISEVADTYISPSHVGEIYWNFGWPGVILISPLIGLLLGWIGARCRADGQVSITRLLVIVVTIYAFAIGSEGTMAVAYVVWLRSMAAIGLLHWIFARRASPGGSAAPEPAGSRLPYPNLLT